MKSSLLDGILANAKDELIIDLTKLNPSDLEVSLVRSCMNHESPCERHGDTVGILFDANRAAGRKEEEESLIAPPDPGGTF
jgi:hypothetical protein